MQLHSIPMCAYIPHFCNPFICHKISSWFYILPVRSLQQRIKMCTCLFKWMFLCPWGHFSSPKWNCWVIWSAQLYIYWGLSILFSTGLSRTTFPSADESSFLTTLPPAQSVLIIFDICCFLWWNISHCCLHMNFSSEKWCWAFFFFMCSWPAACLSQRVSVHFLSIFLGRVFHFCCCFELC